MKNNWTTFEEFKAKSLLDPEIRREYERLKPQYEVINALIEARKKRSVTQSRLAKKMGTTQSAIARVESGSGNPSLKFMQKLADALGARLEIKFHFN